MKVKLTALSGWISSRFMSTYKKPTELAAQSRTGAVLSSRYLKLLTLKPDVVIRALF